MIKPSDIDKIILAKRMTKEDMVNYELPQYLYHATFKGKVKSILNYGLNGKPRIRRTFDFSKKGVVCLSIDPEEAKDFILESDYAEMYDLYESDVYIIKIDTSKLDIDKLYPDTNIDFNDDDNLYSYEYTGVIPSSDFVWVKHYTEVDE